MGKIRFSILMPIYNKEKCLKLYLPKIKNQTYKNFEVIMIDDCSEDNSYEIMKEYASIDFRFRIFKNKKNQGVGYTRNRLLKKAAGKYIIFVDPDDYIENDLLEKLLDSTKNDIEIVRFQNVVEAATKKQLDIEQEKDKYRFCCSVETDITGPEAVMKWCTGLISINAMLWTYCIKKDLYFNNKIKFQNIRVHEDFSVVPLLLFHCKSIRVLDYIGYHYLQYDSSLTKLTSRNRNDRLDQITYKHRAFKSEVNRLIRLMKKINIDDKIKEKFIVDLKERLIDREIKYNKEKEKLLEN